MNRRDFLGLSAAAAAGMLVSSSAAESRPDMPKRKQPIIPRWRGFNLTELTGGQRGQAFRESDFAWMAGWGFDFARLPCSYWAWSSPKDWMTIDEAALKPLDDAIELGRKHGIHLNLNLHRIPGYCVNQRELEPHLLFDSPRSEMEQALAAARHHWQFLAHRYRDVPANRLSFDLFNEPPFMKDQSRYVEIARDLIATIRAESPDRLIVADGADIGQTPVMGLVDEGIVQSTRGYLPKMVSHYTATWVPPAEFESTAKPTWPMVDKHGVLWNREKLREELIVKWQPLTDRGVPIHVGEWGCFDRTPHDVCLAWMGDLLALWKQAGWGWSMWNLRGSFGIVDSGRDDVTYEKFHGHQLDRKMLELLLAS
ncbi:MAG TPA: cellulase family glycosylhydrolase [Opitutaceae bacterium]|nr:cellulase family glycosylhydrolase [Opitutaceae bacterium]